MRNDYLTGTPTYTLKFLSNMCAQAHAKVAEKGVSFKPGNVPATFFSVIF